MKTGRSWWISVGLLIGLLLAGCQPTAKQAVAGELPTAPATPAASAQKSVKIGYIPVGAVAPIFVAYEKGYTPSRDWK